MKPGNKPEKTIGFRSSLGTMRVSAETFSCPPAGHTAVSYETVHQPVKRSPDQFPVHGVQRGCMGGSAVMQVFATIERFQALPEGHNR
jgi:hypothetical protein